MGSSSPAVIGRMGDGKTCAHRAIEERIQAAIQPALARADRALWELQNPRSTAGRHSTEWVPPWKPAYHNRLQP